VEKSLLRQEEGPEDEPRFVMLETVHEYAREKLQESGEAKATKHVHAQYFLALAEEAEPELKGPDQTEWLERLEVEHDNMRAALAWALESEEEELALRLAGALWWLWLVRGHLSEGRDWLEEALESEGGAPVSVRAKALVGAGRLVAEQGDLERGTALLEEGVALFREAGPKGGLADALDNLGIAQYNTGAFERAEALYEESVGLFREAGDGWGVAECLNNLAIMRSLRGEADQEIALHEESLKIRRELGDKRGIAMSLHNLAECALEGGDYERAEDMFEEVLRLGQELEEKTFVAGALQGHGEVALERGDLESAAALLGESLRRFQEIGFVWGVIASLYSLATVAVPTGATERAARLWGAVDGHCRATGANLDTMVMPRFYERYRATARTELGEAAWQEALTEGRAMPLEDAISYALAEEEAGG